jgi:hypothetical protein
MRPGSLLLALLAVPLAFASAAADPPRWDQIAGVDTVSVVTNNGDGTERYTTVWLVVVGERGYLRTGDTTWGANVVREPRIRLIVGRDEYPLRVEFVEAEDERTLVTEAFNAKYGWTDTALGWLRGARPKIMRLRSIE